METINIQAAIGECTEFKTSGRKQTVQVVISPLKVTTSEDGLTVKVTSGCNLWKGCGNDKCQYSLIARPQN
jgi:hypothetical protein